MKLSPGTRKIVQGLLMGALGAVLALALWLPGWLDGFEARTWDLRERLFAKPGATTSDVVTIILDDQSLEWAKGNGISWPWPRQLYAMVAQFCKEAGAKALVLDMLYSEPSFYGVDDDRALRDGLKDNGNVVGAVQLSEHPSKGASTDWPAEAAGMNVTISGLEGWISSTRPKNITFTSVQTPIPELAQGVRFLANTFLPADSVDNVYRREPLFSVLKGRVVPTEALAAWLIGHPQTPAVSIRLGTLSVGDVSVPIDSNGRAILRFRGPSLTHTAFSAAAVLQSVQQMSEGKPPNIDPSKLRGKYVFFGPNAPALLDLKPTPMSGSYPGVEVNATLLDNLLSGDFVRPGPLTGTIVLLLLLCIGAAVAASFSSRAALTALIYVVSIPVAPALGFAAYAAGYWLQMVALELGVVVSLVGSSLASYATEGQQKRYIKGAFKQYLSPTIIEELIAHPERLTLGGQKRDLSIFFSDLQGFTSISEVLTPEELTQLLNDYLTAMTDIIQEEGGTIDKYEGDAIIAFWNAPLDQADHAVRAVRSALRCQAKLDELRPVFRQRVKKDLFKRIGINSGPAVVGNFGSHTKFNYTMLGDAVNLASRLEGVNKQFKTFTMISSMVKERLGDAFPLREVSRIAVVGRKEPVTVYEPMLPEVFESRKPMLQTFHEGLQEYYAGRFPEAIRIFETIADKDPPASCYVEKCRKIQASPPTDGWSGVWVMTEK